MVSSPAKDRRSANCANQPINIVQNIFSDNFSTPKLPSSTPARNSLPDHLHDPAVDSEQFRRDLRRISSQDIRNVSALEVLRNRALQIDIYLLTYLLV